MAATQPTLAGRSVGQWLRGQPGLIVAIVVAELLALIMTSATNPYEYVDGEVYQLGAQALLSGEDLYVNLAPTSGGMELPFIYPPFAAILFTPLAVLPKMGAVLAIMLVSHLALFATLYVVLGAASFLRAHRKWVLLLTAAVLPLATITEPVLETINYAQINIVLMALAAVDLLWRIDGSRKLPYPRGILLGIAAGIKLTPLVFLLFPLLRKDVRTIVTSALTFLGTVAIGFIATASDSVRFWTSEMFASSNVSFGDAANGDASVYAGNQSLRSLLTKLGVPAVSIVLIVVLVVVFVLTVLAMRYAIRQGDLAMAVTVNGLLGVLASPISWSHHWVWAIPALVLLVGSAVVGRRWGLLLTSLMVTGFIILGPHWTVPQGDGEELRWGFFTQLIGNSYVYFGLALTVYLAVLWVRDWRGGAGKSAQAPIPDQPVS